MHFELLRDHLITGKVTEREWMSYVRQLADQGGWITYHTHTARFSDPGFPDLVMVREVVLFAELKTNKGTLTERQSLWLALLEAVRSPAVEVAVWRPRDVDAVTARLLRAREKGGMDGQRA